MERIIRELLGLLIYNLTTRICKYIYKCKIYYLGQIDYQQRIGNYMPICPPIILIYIIAINFITDLLPVPSARRFDLYNQLITVTYAASKRYLLMPGYSIYTAKD
ncbi:unnamed protein product [Fusarium fujikuroi]|nr:unnamed protein product [Fusarium fujikuroi]